MKKIILLTVFLCTFSAFAQIKVETDGNVAIGDVGSTDMQLTVRSDSELIARFHYSGTETFAGFRLGRNLSYTDFVSSTDGFGIGVGTNSGNLPLSTPVDAQIDFFISKSTGYVGIGTNNPEGNLQIGEATQNGMVFIGGGKGYAGIGSTRSDGGLILGKNIYAKYSGAADNYLARVGKTGSHGFSGMKLSHNGKIDFFGFNGNVTEDDIANSSANIKMSINENGNIGIGTTDPNNKIQISGTGDLINQFTHTNWQAGIGDYVNNKGEVLVGTYNDQPAIQGHGSNTFYKLLLNPFDGDVGIGTTDPKVKLDVNGVIRTSSEMRAKSINPGFLFDESDLVDHNWHLQVNDGNFRVFEVDDDRLNWDLKFQINKTSGNVGIGTADTFGHQLAVNGSIVAKGDIIMDYVDPFSPWPDYVFDKEYNLLSLKEVEQHINEKGHLPNVPSAKEVEKNGFSVGEMNKKLLEKVEELMLYTIQQEKRIKALEDKLTEKKG
jgi:hypothetical protein